MKKLLLFSLLVFLSACSEPTKEDALDYYFKIKFEITASVFKEIDLQEAAIEAYAKDPDLIAKGPSTKEYQTLIARQKKIPTMVKKCVEQLQDLSPLGDKALYRESVKGYFKERLKFENQYMMKFIKMLEGGITTYESVEVAPMSSQAFTLQKQRTEVENAEQEFLAEYGIFTEDIEKRMNR